MTRRTPSLLVLLLLVVFMHACMLDANKNHAEKVLAATDTPDSGTIHISVDETFRPVIDEQIKVYESSHPDAHILAEYKPEIACFKDLQNDNTRLVIVARHLSRIEKKFFEEQLQYSPMQAVIAYDAVAVVLNQTNADSVFTINALQSILAGKTNKMAVMDGKNATSTVRFLQDSVLRGLAYGKNVVAAKSSADVVRIVSEQPSAVGFVGLGWVGDDYDKVQKASLSKIRLGLVECKVCDKGVFAKPSQATITFSQYPLVRPLYCIVKENATGLGTGFLNFLCLERGQLIFRRSFLAPAKIGFLKRTVNM